MTAVLPQGRLRSHPRQETGLRDRLHRLRTVHVVVPHRVDSPTSTRSGSGAKRRKSRTLPAQRTSPVFQIRYPQTQDVISPRAHGDIQSKSADIKCSEHVESAEPFAISAGLKSMETIYATTGPIRDRNDTKGGVHRGLIIVKIALSTHRHMEHLETIPGSRGHLRVATGRQYPPTVSQMKGVPSKSGSNGLRAWYRGKCRTKSVAEQVLNQMEEAPSTSDC